MAFQYLISAEPTQEGVKLTLFNPSTNTWEEVLDKEYRPYFFIPCPMSPSDRETVEELCVKTRVEEKRELFTGQTIRVTRVELEASSDPVQASEKFEKSWEGDIPLTLSYVYDHGLTFGAQHLIQGEQVKAVFQIPQEAKQRFEDIFSAVRATDPEKYDLLERLFTLFSQPVPKAPPERLGIKGKVDPRGII